MASIVWDMLKCKMFRGLSLILSPPKIVSFYYQTFNSCRKGRVLTREMFNIRLVDQANP